MLAELLCKFISVNALSAFSPPVHTEKDTESRETHLLDIFILGWKLNRQVGFFNRRSVDAIALFNHDYTVQPDIISKCNRPTSFHFQSRCAVWCAVDSRHSLFVQSTKAKAFSTTDLLKWMFVKRGVC